MAVASLGRTGFEDVTIPVPGKSEFGMDTLTRRMTGYIGGLEAFIQGLAQGATFPFGGTLFYLQSWQPDDSTPVASVTLNYKGLKPGGTPIPDIQTDIVSTVGRATKSYLDQNGGNGITLRDKILWKFGYYPPNIIPTPIPPVDEIIGKRPVWTTSANLEFIYHAVESRYRYIQTGRPAAPKYTEVLSDYVPKIEEARVTTSDGMTYGIDNIIVFNMTPVLHTRVVSWSSKAVLGSPYFECEDIVRLELVDPAEFN